MGDEAKLIDPSGIPHFIGDLATLDTDVMLMTADAGQFRASGSDVHTEFQGLSAFYKAPEAEQLFATTLPVKQKSDAFADDLEKVADALSDYSIEVQPLVKKLDALKADATEFVNSVAGDEHWRKDQDKVDHNNDLWHDVNHTVAAFHTAERAAYNKVMALIGGHKLTADDGSHGKNMYGYRADDLDHAKETPWGAPVEREYEGWSWLAHQSKQVWDGVWHDGVIGTIKGLGTMFGKDGWHAAGEAWKNLAKLSTASSLTSATMGAWWLLPDDKLPSWLRDSRTVHKQAMKGFVAYDQWKTNPARAAGAAGFNVLTVVGTEGAGAAVRGAGEAGAATRTLAAVGKVGRAFDPMTYVGKAGKFAFVKVGDTFTRLKNLQTGAYLDLPEKYALPESARRIPDDAVPDIDAKGNLVYLTRDGDILNADGSLRQHADEAAHELSANDRNELDSPARADHSRELVGADARAEHGAGAARPGGRESGQTGKNAGGQAVSRDGSANGSAGGESFERPGVGSGRAGHGSAGAGYGDGVHSSEPHHASADHDTADTREAHDPPAEESNHRSEAHTGGSPEDEPDFTRRALPPGTADRTLREMQAMRHSRARYKGAEDYARQIAGGAPERHYGVPTHDHPYYPVKGRGGRNVDVPVDMPGGRTLAVEVKHYLGWRTIKFKDGSSRAVRGEVPLSDGIIEQINKDLTLRRLDPKYDPRWVFLHASPSQALRNYLIQARIIFVEYGPPPK
ncbi:hypothetical protein AQI88_24690 [Streptomyces cellostaticus]|uniref:Uncharacterized protein n=1 Tax=Streptomyces cellostaticus TaxID=67285 RepID=A0A124HCC2_9ACTN|nr:hypothetical protein [Streptomyces cellostaticus]KUM93938.1 hypothetical protein AQI88_24690 [Streptomyces cellostaticus]GHI04876.1 hypothetical protein Scel_31970 [Streptomyces cellostaticus]